MSLAPVLFFQLFLSIEVDLNLDVFNQVKCKLGVPFSEGKDLLVLRDVKLGNNDFSNSLYIFPEVQQQLSLLR